jgi:hypothetical protein
LAAHFDLLPTLLDLCGIVSQPAPDIDGRSLKQLLQGIEEESWRSTLVVHSQRVDHPEKWRKCAVMRIAGEHDWRLIDGKELYDLRTDPGQTKDIASEHSEVVDDLREYYENWWSGVSRRFGEYSDIPLGDPASPVQQLCCHDWHPGDAYVPWSQSGQQGVAGDPLVNGLWAVEVAQDCQFTFTLRVRPEGTTSKLAAGTARVKIGDIEKTADIPADADSVAITLSLQKSGHVMLQTWLTDREGNSRGAYYVTVKSLVAES